ncbi:carbohydrate-binding family 9-like protein [Sphingobacterium pedocola]|uniref:Carbohydrate-binding domain-containing protein n=1 Tax=Sphingobacterium pedocola TaxID=2082722 RepID=A0ABR9T565_9SPHI|nr:carbohydrate-binding family 9-like protein [Sphingobacterium pedocola]MBE8720483.1 hypothetical protein [Sphingobacterium pedocola]
MSTLVVKKINEIKGTDFFAIREEIKDLSWNSVAESPWKADFPYSPVVGFQIAHTDSSVILHYAVKEEFLKAQYIRSNENVWEDSCVEFFISLDNKESYYNFEFNILGTGLIGYGSAVKAERKRLAAGMIDAVNTYSAVCKVDGQKKWNLILQIPKTIIGTTEWSGRRLHANFYKCGDKLPNPHFIVWNNIDHPTPNFHLPEFFGDLIIE